MLVDKSPVICGVWDYLIRASASEIADLPDVIEDVRTIDAPQEAKWWIGFWLNAAVTSPRNIPSAWMRSGTAPKSHWGPHVKRRAITQQPMIRGWSVHCGSYEDVPNVPATWIVDPPYQIAGRHYPHGSGSIDFENLASFVRSRRGNTFAHENEGADWLPFEPFGTFKAASKRGAGMSKEVIYMQVNP